MKFIRKALEDGKNYYIEFTNEDMTPGLYQTQIMVLKNFNTTEESLEFFDNEGGIFSIDRDMFDIEQDDSQSNVFYFVEKGDTKHSNRYLRMAFGTYDI